MLGTFKVGPDPLNPTAQISPAGQLNLDGGAVVQGSISALGTLSTSNGALTVDANGNFSTTGTIAAGGVSADLDLLNNRVTNLGAPVAATDAVSEGS